MMTEANSNPLLDGSRRGRLPVIRPASLAESGLACLAMVSIYWGRTVEVSLLRQRFGINSVNNDVTMLIRVAEKLKLTTKLLSVDEIDKLAGVQTPAILYWGFDRFVVLKSFGRRLVVHDPGKGLRRVKKTEASKFFTGVVLEVWPGQGFSDNPTIPNISLYSLMEKPAGLKALFTRLFLAGMASEIITLTIPFIMQWGIDNVSSTGDFDLLNILCMIFVALSISQAAIVSLRGLGLNTATANYTLNWKLIVFRQVIDLPLQFFIIRRTGEITSRFESIEKIVNTVNDNFVEGLIDSVFGLLTGFVLFIYSPSLALVTISGALIYVVLRLFRYSSIRELIQENIVAGAKENSTLIETIKGIHVIKLFGRKRQREQEWIASAVEEANANLALSETQILFRFLSSVIGAFEQVGVFWISIYLIVSGRMTVGMYIAFSSYRGQFYSSVSGLADNVISLKVLQVHAYRVAEIMTEKREGDVVQSGLTERIGELEQLFELKNISFCHNEASNAVLTNVSLRLPQGESVAIVGQSGCGKSTLLGVLLGLYKPMSGSVLFGGVPITSMPFSVFRQHIGAVMQHDILFAGTIAQNISSFDDEVDNDWVQECARIACIDRDIMTMPMGYGTLVSDGGSTLSGGQRQRICIARALYRRPSFLFMDEATNQLDIPTEKELNDRVSSLNITRIIVAHRIDTIKSANRVIRLSEGRIVSDTKAVDEYSDVNRGVSGAT